MKSVIISLHSSYWYALKREAPNGEHYRITSTSRVRCWAPNIAGEKLNKKKNYIYIPPGNELRTPARFSKHFTNRPQWPMLYLCSIKVLYTYTLWLSFDALLSEEQSLIHRCLTSITMLQRQNNHVDNYNGLWLNGNIHRLSKLTPSVKSKEHCRISLLLVSGFQFFEPGFWNYLTPQNKIQSDI